MPAVNPVEGRRYKLRVNGQELILEYGGSNSNMWYTVPDHKIVWYDFHFIVEEFTASKTPAADEDGFD